MKRRTQSLLLKYLIQILFYLLGIGMGLSIIYYGIKELAGYENPHYAMYEKLTSIKEWPTIPQNNDIIGC